MLTTIGCKQGLRAIPGNAFTINLESGEIQASSFGPPEDPARIAAVAEQLNRGINRRVREDLPDLICSDEDDSSDGDSCCYSDDDDEEGWETVSSSESEEHNCVLTATAKSLTVTSEDQDTELYSHKLCKESAPRRHPLFDIMVDNFDKSSIDILPDVCLSKIFTLLPTLEMFKLCRVSKRWYNVSSSVLKSIKRLSTLHLYRGMEKFQDEHAILNQTNLVTILSLCGDSLTELYLDTRVEEPGTMTAIPVFKEISTAVSRHCRNLDTLVITVNKLGGTEVIKSFAKHLSAKNKIKKLALIGGDTKRDKDVLTEELLGEILRKTKKLETLHVGLSGGVTGISVTKYLQNNKMKSISFNCCPNLEFEVMEFIFKSYHQTLEELHLYYDYFPFDHGDYDSIMPANENAFGCLPHKIPKSEKLTKFSAMTQDESFQNMGNVDFNFFQLMPNLEVLDLSSNCDLEDIPGFFKTLAAMCPLIRDLSISGANIDDVRSLRPLENMFFLKHLRMESVSNDYIGPYWCMFDFENFARDIIPRLKSLTHLHLGSTDIYEENVFLVIQKSPSLRYLDLTSYHCDDSISGQFILLCHRLQRFLQLNYFDLRI